MENDNLIKELRTLQTDLKFLGYAIWALGAMQNLRASTDSRSGEHAPLDLKSPEQRELTLYALKGFLTLAQFVRNEYEKPDSTLPILSTWKM
jgi:hypothetical protein